MPNLWGNPELKSFKNNHIRRVIVDTARVFVHKNLTNEVEEILLRASASGAIFSNDGLPNILPAFEMDDSPEAKFGLKFQIPDFQTQIDVADLKFKQIGDVFIYTEFDTNQQKEPVEISTYYDERGDKIGISQLNLGSQGKQVKFMAYFLGFADASQVTEYEKTMVEAVKFFQRRMGIPETGTVDWYTWGSILPKGSERIAAGYAGAKVRALQSALVVNGYNCPVTSRFGTETIRSVREFQQANNLRVTGRVGLLEWNLLFQLK